MRTMNRTVRAVAVCGVLFGGCAEQSVAEDGETEEQQVLGTESALAAGCTKLGTDIDGHSCTHGTAGPFTSESASSDPNFAGADPKIEVIHDYTTVTLPGSGGSYAGTVKFTPANNDDHAIYIKPTSGSVTVTVRDNTGATVSPLITGTLTPSCAYLSSYKVYYMSAAGAPYKIDMSASVATFKMLLEEVSPFGRYWYKDVDVDTWGDPATEFWTPCVPPSGWTVKRKHDCNDNNFNIKPGAAETPNDGIDSNCNGHDNT